MTPSAAWAHLRLDIIQWCGSSWWAGMIRAVDYTHPLQTTWLRLRDTLKSPGHHHSSSQESRSSSQCSKIFSPSRDEGILHCSPNFCQPHISLITHFFKWIYRETETERVKADIPDSPVSGDALSTQGWAQQGCAGATDIRQGLLGLQKDCPGYLHAHPSLLALQRGREEPFCCTLGPMAHTELGTEDKCKHSWLLWLPEKVSQE